MFLLYGPFLILFVLENWMHKQNYEKIMRKYAVIGKVHLIHQVNAIHKGARKYKKKTMWSCCFIMYKNIKDEIKLNQIIYINILSL